ncbi:LRR and PYD domains-containing 12-like protein [Labeo rohita]|uniref:LRR and PYD domains-containing 12-like protein n=1 Tax=Labeo rohita TaxID=84645 RepID=A0A498NE78_LABRO|nr:LRR and PYD domains-containing 12-like protein [Labeo rohita]
MAEPPKFSDKTGHLQPNLSEKVKDSTIYHQFQRPASPLPSNASLKSDRSMAEPPKFSDKTDHLKPSLPEKVEDCAVYHQFQRPASPLPSNASLKSDRSMAEPPKFSDKTDYLKPGIFSLPEKVEDCAVYHQFQRPASPLPMGERNRWFKISLSVCLEILMAFGAEKYQKFFPLYTHT